MDSIKAIVLAGGKNSDEMRQATGVSNRALVELAPDRTMLDFVMGALRQAKSIAEIYVVGDVPATPETTPVAPGSSMLDNILLGIAAAKPMPGQPVLVVTSDIPFITSAAVDDFVVRANAAPVDFGYPIIPMDAYNREFAGMKRTTLKLREGRFTGGNMVLLSPDRLVKNKDLVMKAYAARKDVLALGRMLGWGLLVRIVLSQVAFPGLLTIAQLETGIGRLMGAGSVARAVITEFASIGTDVDKPDDVAYARERLGK
ncbi:MAG: nucleotidyltransferase family protein [Capsulimonadaceae bacterium]|nr:nucleotidyltransferase family protein [Capsulimonadaceae bacterium]